MNYKTVQKQIAECRYMIGNGMPVWQKPEIAGIMRGLELKLDRAKQATKDAYKAKRWN
ncbi:hypothetical protein KY316_01875 [Candidatus Woesearchaeota archaeon]|nr:hypothetical protein [Candidatus Woesearchaeota archaeon]